MNPARRLLRYRRLAVWLVALTLAMRMLVPAGFMPVMAGGGIVVAPCPAFGPVVSHMGEAAHMTGMAQAHGDDARHGGHGGGKGDASAVPCVFAGLAAPSLAATDPLILAVAVAAILGIILRRTSRPPAARQAHLRPPLRGPPINA